MIFMHLESGELYELLILSVTDDNFTYGINNILRPAFRIGEFTLYGEGIPTGMTIDAFADNFVCIGFL